MLLNLEEASLWEELDEVHRLLDVIQGVGED